jgi:hypothetical protein
MQSLFFGLRFAVRGDRLCREFSVISWQLAVCSLEFPAFWLGVYPAETGVLHSFAVSCQSSVVSWQFAVGSLQLAVGSWQLAVGSWQLAVGSW